ncbi:sigma-70 family RNA polymerase sigma factor [Chamaesiphon sp. VAR_69_metabat_338]|uniref:sigma-70 family RNA polymerase sigma factor n=1 Tax=Chamaesiphon sp. VAR_69_metabat_338 TaxID=2964704 RepID=UPI00286EB408|nr:sigma-70 family RNA polymerase sigma factor [Chamaesiphon sp. VAR_69_metabat_338]
MHIAVFYSRQLVLKLEFEPQLLTVNDLKMLSIPTFAEANHEILQSLADRSDRELVGLHQLHPEQGKFFTALFCRYGAIVHSVVQQAVESQAQADYLFAIAWRQIFAELGRVQLATDLEATNWQSWLMDITGSTIDRVEVPTASHIRSTLAEAPPPLRCYLERGLDAIPPLSRLIVVMTESLKWNEQRISAYLQGEGQKISTGEIPTYLAAGYEQLEAAVPNDIRDIYLHKDL